MCDLMLTKHPPLDADLILGTGIGCRMQPMGLPFTMGIALFGSAPAAHLVMYTLSTQWIFFHFDVAMELRRAFIGGQKVGCNRSDTDVRQ